MFKAIKQTLSYPSISKRGLRSAVSEALRYFRQCENNAVVSTFLGTPQSNLYRDTVDSDAYHPTDVKYLQKMFTDSIANNIHTSNEDANTATATSNTSCGRRRRGQVCPEQRHENDDNSAGTSTTMDRTAVRARAR